MDLNGAAHGIELTSGIGALFERGGAGSQALGEAFQNTAKEQRWFLSKDDEMTGVSFTDPVHLRDDLILGGFHVKYKGKKADDLYSHLLTTRKVDAGHDFTGALAKVSTK